MFDLHRSDLDAELPVSFTDDGWFLMFLLFFISLQRFVPHVKTRLVCKPFTQNNVFVERIFYVQTDQASVAGDSKLRHKHRDRK